MGSRFKTTRQGSNVTRFQGDEIAKKIGEFDITENSLLQKPKGPPLRNLLLSDKETLLYH